MKTKLLALTSLTTLLLAALCVWQHRQLRSTQARLDRVESELIAESQARSDQESRSEAFKRREDGLRQQVIELSSVLASLHAAEAKRASNNFGTAKPLPVAAAKESSD